MPVLYMEKSSIDSLNEKDIKEIVDENSIGTKYQHLEDYYRGKHDILHYTKQDRTSPNNRVVHNMAKYVTDTMTGYFIGKPVIYGSRDGNENYLQELQSVYEYNDEQDHNAELVKQGSIKGTSFEMLYIDERANIRFATVAPENLIMIYATGETEPMAVMRTIYSVDKNKNRIRKVEFWDAENVIYFKSINGGNLNLEEIEEHYWKDVPFVEYPNNAERIGDFEGIITQIDAYNKAVSNTANLFQYNDDALLKILKMGAVTAEDIKAMKEAGAVILEDGGDIDWLIKQINDTAMENHKNRLRSDMHTFASVPYMGDESFASNASGVAMGYKLWGMEQVAATKERKFKRGLQRRIELITNILNIKGGNYDYRDITMQFRRNVPQNLLEIAQIGRAHV